MRKGRNHKIKEINTDKEMPCTVCMRGPTIETSSWEGAHFLTDTETPGGGGGGLQRHTLFTVQAPGKLAFGPNCSKSQLSSPLDEIKN